MMTGQLLAGADPLSAAKYQIVVMLMLSAANTVAIVTACFMTYRSAAPMDIIWTRAYARIIIYNRIDVKGRSVVAGEPSFPILP
ncbi:MAG: ABC transporter permease [Eggerthellaceae bacterium]